MSHEYDYDFTIPGERMGSMRELIRAGVDALDPETDADAIDLGKNLLRQMS
jgi:hypothetical protein